MEWTPTLDDRSGPLYRRIVDALAVDIADGRLLRGQQLPTHRRLAESLDVDLSTITHAYREARERGLVEARVGQGTFVAETMAQRRVVQPPWVTFDLSMNLPPQPLDADLEGRIARGIAAISREDGLSAYLNYREAAGTTAEREAAAQWLRPRIPGAEASRLLICPGTQTSLTLLLAALTSPGDTVLTEALTFPGMKAAASFAGVTLVGVPTDASGILPDALRTACRRHKPKALYLIPTIHNPTTVTMPQARRVEIAEVLRKTGLALIEDDAYGALAPEARPIAALAPEQTWHAASISKCIAPGLRISFLLAPDRLSADRLSERLRANVQMTAPLMAMLVARWIRDGSADAIVKAIREEAAARQKIAAKILAGCAFAAHPHGHHIWLSLPRNWVRDDFVTHVQRRGLAIVGSESFRVSGDAPSAIRVALGAAASRHELTLALTLLAETMHGRGEASGVV
jgi:DNA-binding transcriptional MocR family regulator